MLAFSGAYDAGTFHAIFGVRARVAHFFVFALKISRPLDPLAVMGIPAVRSPGMKIALVAQHATSMSDESPAGGTVAGLTGPVNDSRLRELSRSLASNGHRVTVYAQRHSATLPDRAEVFPGVTVEYM